MSTYTTLQSNIAATLSRNDLTSQIQEAIQRAVRHYERKLFWFSYAEDSFIGSATPKQAFTISSTNTFQSIEQVVVNYNSARYDLIKENLDVIKGWDATNSNGLPRRWAYDPVDRTIRFDINLNVTATISYTYIAKNVTLSAAGDSNLLSTNAPDLLEAYACWWLYLTKIKNGAAAQAMKNVETDILYGLECETTAKLSSGRVTATKF